MSNYDNVGPAFPSPDIGEQDFSQRGAYPGMTLRDYFAAKAMAAWHSNPNPNDSDISWVAEWSYRMADQMLAARAAKEQK